MPPSGKVQKIKSSSKDIQGQLSLWPHTRVKLIISVIAFEQAVHYFRRFHRWTNWLFIRPLQAVLFTSVAWVWGGTL